MIAPPPLPIVFGCSADGHCRHRPIEIATLSADPPLMQRKRANRFSTGVSIASAGKSKTAYETCARFEVFAGMSGHGDQKLVAAGGEDIGRFAI
jgi:hypothetical protein